MHIFRFGRGPAFRSVRLAMLLVVAAGVPASAGEIRLAWDPNPESEVAGYLLMARKEGETTYSTRIDVGLSTTHTFSELQEGAAYYFSVAAYAASGARSAAAPEVRGVVPFNLRGAPGAAVLVWANTASGLVEAWSMRGGALSGGVELPPMDTRLNLAGTGDFNGDGQGDLLFQRLADGALEVWLMDRDRRLSIQPIAAAVGDANWQVAAVGDMNGDGSLDLVLQHQTLGMQKIWMLNGLSRIQEVAVEPARLADTNWKIVGVMDADRDGDLDLLWQHLVDGWVYVALLSGTVTTSSEYLIPARTSDAEWVMTAVVDSDGDGWRDDIVWRHRLTGRLSLWQMEGRALQNQMPLAPSDRSLDWELPGARHRIVRHGDIDGDRRSDLLMRNRETSGLEAWLMVGPRRRVAAELSLRNGNPRWQAVALADFNSDGRPDVFWQHVDGWLAVWMLNGTEVIRTAIPNPAQEPDSYWRIAAAFDVDGDGHTDLVWQHLRSGAMRIWRMNGVTRIGVTLFNRDRTVDPFWRIVGAGDLNGDGRKDLIWWHSTEGWLEAWYLQGTSVIASGALKPGRISDTNWRPVATGDFDGDGRTDIVWQHQLDGMMQWWDMMGDRLLDSHYVTPLFTERRVAAAR